jgi:hypothetical protein
VSDKAEKAIIIAKELDKRVTCLFNPKEYVFSKQITYGAGKTSGKNLPKQTFQSGSPAKLQMQLFFDTYEQRTDVREYTDQLWEMVFVNPKLKDKQTKWGRPPLVRFQWGETWLFDAVITSVSQRFTLFLPSGIPVRATLDVTFQQIEDTKDLKQQNPTSGGAGGERVWIVKEGDTLAWIAYKEYGDPSLWRTLADANKLQHVRRLCPGTQLMVPDAE